MLSVAETKKVAYGRFDAWFGLVVPPHTEDDFAQVKWVTTGDGRPDMGDTAGSGYVGQYTLFSGGDGIEVAVATTLVVARAAQRTDWTNFG